MSLPYTEEDFISASECQRLIDYAIANKKADVSSDDEYSTEVEWKDHGAKYYAVSYTHLTLPTKRIV